MQFSTGLPWLPSLEDSHLVEVFDSFVDSCSHSSESICSDDFLLALKTELLQRRSSFIRKALRDRLPKLLLLPLSHVSTSVGDLASHILASHLPLGLRCPESLHHDTLGRAVADAIERWGASSPVDLRLPDDPIITSAIVETDVGTYAMYLSGTSMRRFAEWLKDEAHPKTLEGSHLRTLHSFLDSYLTVPDAEKLKIDHCYINRIMVPLLRRLLLRSCSREDADLITGCIISIFRINLPQGDAIIESVLGEVKLASHHSLFSTRFQLLLYRLLQIESSPSLLSLLNDVIECGLEWIVRRFAEDDHDSVHTLDSLDVFGRSTVRPNM